MNSDKQFAKSMTMTLLERTAWDMFITVIYNIYGKKKSVNYKDHITNILKAFQKLGCNMTIIVHFWFSHSGRFSDNLGDISGKQSE